MAKISFDFDDTLNTARGKELAKRLISEGNTLYIISARNGAQNMYSVADAVGIPHSRVYATGSNSEKVKKVKELNIDKHYDNNIDVINELGNIGVKFHNQFNKFEQMEQRQLPIYDLLINEDIDSAVEVDAVALVDRPAIERNFLAFRAEEFVEPRASESEADFMNRCMSVMVGDEGYEQEQAAAICYTKWRERGSMSDEFQESITDIPDDVRANARNAVEWAEKNSWGSCGTQVGKTRASQLAKAGGAVSLDTVRRMYSYLSRHEGDLDSSKSYADGCGKLMYDAWGGKAGLRWSRNVLRNELRAAFAIEDEEKQIISGPIMLADTPIYRREGDMEYYVRFPKKTVKDILLKIAKKGYHTKFNIMHDSGQFVDGVTIFEIWMTDRERGIMPMKGFEDVPDGSAFASAKVENAEVWAAIKEGKLRGFSVEGIFNYSLKPDTVEEEMMSRIKNILKQITK